MFVRSVRGVSGVWGVLAAFGGAALLTLASCGSQPAPTASSPTPATNKSAPNDDVKNAVRSGFKYMELAQAEGDKATRKCFSCHHTSEPLETQLLGMRSGFDSPAVTARFCSVAQDLREQAEAAQGPMVVGSNQFKSAASVTIKALQFLNAFHYPYDMVVSTMLRFTLAEQEKNGSWGPGPRVPPKHASRVVDIFEIAEGFIPQMPANEPQRKDFSRAITRAAKWLPTYDVSTVEDVAPYDEAAQLRGMLWLKRQAAASPSLIEEPIDVPAVERKQEALRKSLIAKAKRGAEGTCWDWAPGECDVYVTAANIMAFQAAKTDPELVQDALRWLVAKQDPKTGRWFAATHSDTQMAVDVIVLDSAFNGDLAKRVHAADLIDTQKKDVTRQEVRKLVRSDAQLQMAIRNEIESAFASGFAMRALLNALPPSPTAKVETAPPVCAPVVAKKEKPGLCMRCHSDGAAAPVVFPFQPENIGAWKEALAKDDKKHASAELIKKILERISLPPDDPDSMPPPDSPEGAVFGFEGMGVRRMMTIWNLEDLIKKPRSKFTPQQRKAAESPAAPTKP